MGQEPRWCEDQLVKQKLSIIRQLISNTAPYQQRKMHRPLFNFFLSAVFIGIELVYLHNTSPPPPETLPLSCLHM